MSFRFSIIIFLLLLPSAGWAQQYAIADITSKADNVLIQNLGRRQLNYCTFDDHSFYGYKKGKHIHYKVFDKQGKTKKHFVSATLRYNFMMPYPACKWLDTVKGTITIVLDSMLGLSNQPDTRFIPETAITGAPCDFIPLQDVLNIAKEEKIQGSIVPPYTYLSYNDSSKQYEWIVLRTLWNKHNNNDRLPTQDDMIVINAANGAVITHRVVPYAPHIR